MAETISRTPWQIAMIKLRRNKLAMFSFWILIVLYLSAIFAGFFSPYGYDHQHRDWSFHHPNLASVHFLDEKMIVCSDEAALYLERHRPSAKH